MSLQIEKLLEEITKSSEDFNNNHGMLAEDTTVKPDYLFEEPVVDSIPETFECVFEDHEMEVPLSEETLTLIENIEYETEKLLASIGY